MAVFDNVTETDHFSTFREVINHKNSSNTLHAKMAVKFVKV